MSHKKFLPETYLEMNKVLVTGAAGFIGYHCCLKLLSEGFEVIGIDNLNKYYDEELKKNRLQTLKSFSKENHYNFEFIKLDLKDKKKLLAIFKQYSFDIVIHLAAQAGVRYSFKNPETYIESNLIGFFNLLESIKSHEIKHFIFASSSSVYGNNKNVPFSENDKSDSPVSLYAATKKSNELMAYSYSHLYQIPTTGLRFFTVYGPYGRPDMAYYKFTKNIIEGKEIDLYGYGDLYRDFTYIDDIVEGIFIILGKVPVEGESLDSKAVAPYEIFNIGNNNPIKISEFLQILENEINISASKNLLPIQPGDVPITFANIDLLEKKIDFKPKTNIKEGLAKFVSWYKDYQKHK